MDECCFFSTFVYVQFSAVPQPIGSSKVYVGRFSGDSFPVFSAEGHCEQSCQGQGCPLFDVVHPAVPLSTMVSPTLPGGLKVLERLSWHVWDVWTVPACVCSWTTASSTSLQVYIRNVVCFYIKTYSPPYCRTNVQINGNEFYCCCRCPKEKLNVMRAEATRFKFHWRSHPGSWAGVA